MKNVMLDIETLGTTHTAAILSIGACYFEPETGEIGETFECVIDQNSCAKAGLTTDPQTIVWWMQQNDEAREVFAQLGNSTLEEAVIDFRFFLHKAKFIWANSPAFDCVILRNAFRAADQTFPIHYRGERCVRTLLSLVPKDKGQEVWGERIGTVHNALDDAIHQAGVASRAWQFLGRNKDD